MRKSLEAVTGQDLGRFFADHVEKPGAARLQAKLSDLRESTGGGFEVAFVIEQTQPGPPLQLDVPVVVQTLGKPATATVRLEGGLAASTVRTEAEPVALHVDPSFDLFRLLDPRETPPSIGQIFGEPRILAVLPAKAPAAEQDGYRKLIESWKSDSHLPEIKTDAEVTELPKDRAVWLLGRTNALAVKLFASGGDYTLDAEKLVVDRESMPLAGHCGVIVRRHPANLEKAIGWIFADGTVALPGLGRKLPHYGKYSYLGFEGDEPMNVLKGQWTATDSPLRVDLRPNAERSAPVADPGAPRAQGARRAAAGLLAEGAPGPRRVALRPRARGPGRGDEGPRRGGRVRRGGVQGHGPAAGRRQRHLLPVLPVAEVALGRGRSTLRNVIGVLPGSKAEWKGQSALLTAHYDHLGLGWPDVHKGDEGKLHPGADDNASGVAVLLELAKALASGEKPQRTIVFVAFAGEEAGLLGSKHYVEHPAFPLDKTIGVINLDTVGRLFDKKVSVIATGNRLRVAAHLPGRGLRDRGRGPDDPGRPRVLRPEELHRQGRAGGADLHGPPRRLPPPRRHRRQDRRAGAREGGDVRQGGDRLPRRAGAAAHEHDRVDEGRGGRPAAAAAGTGAPARTPARAGASASARCPTSRSPAPA